MRAVEEELGELLEETQNQLKWTSPLSRLKQRRGVEQRRRLGLGERNHGGRSEE
ncbi:unnamed protein product [Linum tenue]|uniref:Uncharacterized protein n=1 Tax=Linum tenue TaxID=586396 RepID=A0AAV0QLN4_9ROSI|nr:unnamed protein product [Linum tenue]